MNTISMITGSMKSNKAGGAHALMVSIDSEKIGAEIVAHPSQSSMGQALAGKGQLVFEGELLETPFSWRPLRIVH